jgi:hypothetical protein
MFLGEMIGQFMREAVVNFDMVFLQLTRQVKRTPIVSENPVKRSNRSFNLNAWLFGFKKVEVQSGRIKHIFMLGKLLSKPLNQVTAVASQTAFVEKRAFCIKSDPHII